jgi:hypothetical protein
MGLNRPITLREVERKANNATYVNILHTPIWQFPRAKILISFFRFVALHIHVVTALRVKGAMTLINSSSLLDSQLQTQ